jgi:hypothetical protein
VESEASFNVTAFLVDHNIEGQALLLWGTLAAEGWLTLLSLPFQTLSDAGLPLDTDDRAVWRFAQAHQMILLTANRSQRGADSLERTLREENTPLALPIITLSNPERMEEKNYREACAIRIVEIVLGLEAYRGTGRLYIP